MGYKQKDRRSSPPKFNRGDWVRPHDYKPAYPGWPREEARQIESVIFEEEYPGADYGAWKYKIFNPMKDDYSRYTPSNFQKAEPMYPKSFFAIAVGSASATENAIAFTGHVSTPVRASRQEVIDDIAGILKEGDTWMICQTVALVQGEPPRPPMKITDYRQ